ncbi:inositol-tetrakisphosphate 1-kinase-like isoform X2 [Narcine bancroftii]|uniref:inositol-tetrakisphosphate 1-kinase-like isoform X2 n=1 Tax=Narcine bancroftii TaxID=1343680 RepID=UPI003831D2B2
MLCRLVALWGFVKSVSEGLCQEMCVELDLEKPIEEQGPLDVIIHKLTDVILEADQNDAQAQELVQRFQDYIDTHPETIILDPLPAIRTLLDRCRSYELIRRLEGYMQDDRICSPPFMELASQCGEDTIAELKKHRLTFPFICKTRVAHGTNSHEVPSDDTGTPEAVDRRECVLEERIRQRLRWKMAIIFSEDGLKDVKPQCVIQSFINHNAVLYKVFVVGDSYTVVERPSLKNFPTGLSDRKSIFFNSHNVSKPESSSDLTALDVVEGVCRPPSDDVIRKISRNLREALGISLFGIDVIINNRTGQHAVIDINAFPGYEGVPEFFTELINHIQVVLQDQNPEAPQFSQNSTAPEQAASICADRACPAASGFVTMATKEAWLVEDDPSNSKRLQHQRLSCNLPPNFQNCVAPMATKASSQ